MSSSAPAKVNRPTDVKQKDADVARKLQLYGIISAFQAGKVPSNDQIDVALNSFLAADGIATPPEKLSDEGKALVADFRNIVKQAQHLILSKNEGNLLQDFIWQTQQWDPKSVNVPGAPVDKETAQKHGNQALEGLRTLGTLMITNGQFRKLLKDASTLLRDMAGDAATNAAAKVRPSEEALSQMDRPAEDNTWHDAPDLKNIKEQARGVISSSKKDAADVAQAGQNAANASGSTNAQDVNAQAGINATRDVLQKKVDEKVPEEDRDKVKARNEEYRRRAREYFQKKMPQERKEQTIWRLKKMVLECQQHPDYAQAIETLLDLAEEYGGHSRAIAQGGTGTVKEARGGLSAAEDDLKTLIERFANGTSTDNLWSAINQIYTDADNDEELKNWFRSMDRYLRRCLLEQGYILDDESSREWDRLYDHGRYLLRNKYRAHTDRVVDEIKFLADQFDQDAQNKAFAQSLQKLFNDLGNDENGKATFKPHLVKDLTDVIIPSVLESIAYIPVPRIEYQDPQVDAIIENLVLESDNFMPNVLEVASENYFKWGRKNVAKNRFRQSVEIKVAGIQMDLRDVSYHIKRKRGFPSLTDTGVVDMLLPGEGFSFKIKMSTADDKDKQSFFKIDKVDVNIKKVNLNVLQSNHKILFRLFKPIALKALRPALQKAVEKAIKDKVNEFDALLYKIKQEADRAVEEAVEDPENAPNIYKRYMTAAQKQLLKSKKKAEEFVADKKVNMAVTKEDSIFPSIHLPGGISSKATEYKELARKGDKWESPVFSIGAAKKSNDIPSAPKVVKKPHGPMNGGMNGATNLTHPSSAATHSAPVATY